MVVESNPYKFQRREIQGLKTHCETCDIVLASKDWSAHANGKKHKANKEAKAAAADGEGVKTDMPAAVIGATKGSRSTSSAPDVECRRCHEMGHFAKDCPKAAAFACHNCGAPDHKSKECPEPRVPTCHNCDQKGHMMKECPEPRVPKCRNCDEKGHMAKECPKPKDWSRVQCNNCQQMGHTAKRCPNPAAEVSGDGGWGDTGNTTAVAAGGWESGAGGGADTGAVSGGWDAPTGEADTIAMATGGEGFGGTAGGDSFGGIAVVQGPGEASDSNAAAGGNGWESAGGDEGKAENWW